MPIQTNRSHGFSLLELLLSLVLGCMIVTVIGEALLGELGQAGRLVSLLQEREVSMRALELIRMELLAAQAVRMMPGPMEREGCGLAGRTVVFHLHFTPEGVMHDRDVTYSLERKPASIWRGQTLMRCGPPYGLNGQMENSTAVSRVLLDGLAVNGLYLTGVNDGLTRVGIKRVLETRRDVREKVEINVSTLIP